MEIATVVGHVWATKKEDTLTGFKLMVVQPVAGGSAYVAADVVSAGIGERVLVVNGSTARRALGSDDCAIDCAIVGIIDSLEVDREAARMRAGEAEEAEAAQTEETPAVPEPPAPQPEEPKAPEPQAPEPQPEAESETGDEDGGSAS